MGWRRISTKCSASPPTPATTRSLVAKKLLAENHRTETRQPRQRNGTKSAKPGRADRQGQAQDDETRGCSPAAASAAGSAVVAAADTQTYDGGGGGFNPQRPVRPGRAGGANIGDLFGGLFNRVARSCADQTLPRQADPETETELDFLEGQGVAMPLRLTSPAPCANTVAAHGRAPAPGLCHLQRLRDDQP